MSLVIMNMQAKKNAYNSSQIFAYRTFGTFNTQPRLRITKYFWTDHLMEYKPDF
jgi:hypothetical protein